jgi:hypothetical protein
MPFQPCALQNVFQKQLYLGYLSENEGAISAVTWSRMYLLDPTNPSASALHHWLEILCCKAAKSTSMQRLWDYAYLLLILLCQGLALLYTLPVKPEFLRLLLIRNYIDIATEKRPR